MLALTVYLSAYLPAAPIPPVPEQRSAAGVPLLQRGCPGSAPLLPETQRRTAPSANDNRGKYRLSHGAGAALRAPECDAAGLAV